jgi:RHS repeat-associated protein
VNGLPINYTLDLNARLTQVLADGTNAYLYGRARIGEQQPGGWQYHHGDALGSVRQLTNSGATPNLARSFEAFGSQLSSMGSTSTVYSFTGEQLDATGLTYLRARYYASGIDRFLTSDPWPGDMQLPRSLNGWTYVDNNPVRFTDPSGFVKVDEAEEASAIVKGLVTTYMVEVVVDWGDTRTPLNPHTVTACGWQEGEWAIEELRTLAGGVTDLAGALGASQDFVRATGGVVVSQEYLGERIRGLTSPHRVKLTNASSSFDTWTVVHELSHAWDANNGWRLSVRLSDFTGGFTNHAWAAIKRLAGKCDPPYNRWPGCNKYDYFYGSIPPAGSDENFNAREDFAESVTAFVYPDQAQEKVNVYLGTIYEDFLYYRGYENTLRWAFVNNLIAGELQYP